MEGQDLSLAPGDSPRKVAAAPDLLLTDVKRNTPTRHQLQELARGSTSIRDLHLKTKGLGLGYVRLKRLLNALVIDTSHFTGMTWNKGLTGKTDARVAANNRNSGSARTGKPGHKHSVGTRRQQSMSRTQYLETHHDHGLQWYEVSCGSVIVKVQGTWEKRVAEWLTENGVRWERRRLHFLGHRQYTPDFYLIDHDVYVEVKGFWRDRDIYKMYLVLDEHDVDIRVVDKQNIGCLSLAMPKFIERFKREDIDMSKFTNIWVRC